MISAPINPPRIYSEWVEVLDMLRTKADDEAVLQALLRGTVEWQSGVAERFAKKLTDTINARMNDATDTENLAAGCFSTMWFYVLVQGHRF